MSKGKRIREMKSKSANISDTQERSISVTLSTDGFPARNVMLQKYLVMLEDVQKELRTPLIPILGSSLSEDDIACGSFKMSTYIHGLLTVAVDHLISLSHLLAGDFKLPARSSYTLIRSAIESSSVVIWMLEKESRCERVEQRLLLVLEGAENEKIAIKELGDYLMKNNYEDEFSEYQNEVVAPSIIRHNGYLLELETIRENLNIPSFEVEVKGKLVYRKVTDATSIIRTAGKLCLGPESASLPVFFWRSCSGVAHAKEWATRRTAHRLENHIVGSELEGFKIDPTDNDLVSYLGCAQMLLNHGYRKYSTAAGV